VQVNFEFRLHTIVLNTIGAILVLEFGLSIYYIQTNIHQIDIWGDLPAPPNENYLYNVQRDILRIFI